jgi:hypothetical protein
MRERLRLVGFALDLGEYRAAHVARMIEHAHCDVA